MRHGWNEALQEPQPTAVSMNDMATRAARPEARASKASLAFPALASKGLPLLGGDAAKTIAALEDIADHMAGVRDDPPRDDGLGVPAGYTYFGQFFMHDMVFSRLGGPSPRTGMVHAKNMTSLALDLDSVYGPSPRFSPHLYEATVSNEGQLERCRLLVGLTRDGQGYPRLRSNDPKDVPRILEGGSFMLSSGSHRCSQPIIGDSRNDDHLILSQLHALFLVMHNRCVELARAKRGDAEDAFRAARRFIVAHYRGAIVHDYLKRLLLPPFHRELLASGANGFLGANGSLGVGLPLDFSLGAARFGHAMARGSYVLNDFFGSSAASLHDPAGIGQILEQSSDRVGADLPPKVPWFVEWRRFFDLDQESPPQPARRIGPMLNVELARAKLVRNLKGKERSIAFADLWRCYQVGIPSGQAYAARVKALAKKLGLKDIEKFQVLSGADILPSASCLETHGAIAKELAATLGKYPEFLENTPLSYYVMQEASVHGHNGSRLGPVGSYLVARTVKAALASTKDDEVHLRDMRSLPRITIAEFIGFADRNRVSDDKLKENMDAFANASRRRVGRNRRTAQ